MVLTVSIPADELEQLRRITKTDDDASAVERAAMEYLRISQLRQLKAASGNVDYQDNWQQLESLELAELGFPI